MTSPVAHVNEAIREFSANMQLEPVSPSDDGSYFFLFENAGLLSFSPSADGRRIIMALKSHDQSPKTADDMKQFLSLARYDPMTQVPISAGMVGGAFVLAANVPDSEFNLQRIELCLDRLISLHS